MVHFLQNVCYNNKYITSCFILESVTACSLFSGITNCSHLRRCDRLIVPRTVLWSVTLTSIMLGNSWDSPTSLIRHDGCRCLGAKRHQAINNYEITEYDNGTWISFWTIHKQIIRRQATRRLLLLVGVVFSQWYHASTKAPLTVWSYYVTYIVVDALYVRMQLLVYFQRNRKQFGISLMYVKPPLHILFTAHTVMPVGCKRWTISMDLIWTAIRGHGVISIKILPEILRSPLPNVDKFWNSAQINQVQVRT